MWGPCERVVTAICVLGVLGAPAVAEPRTYGARAGEHGAASAPPDQMDLFQGLSLGSNKEPIQINADSLELDYKQSVLTYSGNVKVTQADVTLTSDRLAITYDRQAIERSPEPGATPAARAAAGAAPAKLGGAADKIKEIVAEGHVRIQRGDRVAEGRRAVFDQAKQTIVLSDGAVLHEGANQVAGDRIIVYLQEQRSVVESGSHSRVSAVFYPNASTSGAPAAAASPSADATPATSPNVGAAPAGDSRGGAAAAAARVEVGDASGAPGEGGH